MCSLCIRLCLFQAYILSIPMGSNYLNASDDTVTFQDFLWNFYQPRLHVWVSKLKNVDTHAH